MFGASEEQISHLQFVDDTSLACKNSKSNFWAIKAFLQLFEVISGLKVNFIRAIWSVWMFRRSGYNKQLKF